MKTINDVLSKTNDIYFKTESTEKEYNCFENIREKMVEEFYEFDDNKKDLYELLKLIDQAHIKYLTEKVASNEDIISEFRQLTFKLF